jgi:hypothetical protein
MRQSLQVLEWKTEAKVEAKADSLLRVLRFRFGPIPPEAESGIQSTSDLDQLDRWLEAALASATFDDFRRAAGV